jgi:hypothetical protein
MTAHGDFSRQGFLGPDAEQILGNLRVTIVGLGGGGSHVAQQLAHIGVGEIRLIDPDAIEDSNLNRLVGATQADVDNSTPKVDIAERLIKGIRPWIKVQKAKADWQAMPHLIADAHILFGCIDGYRQRKFLEVAARKYGISHVDIGMDVTRVGDSNFAVAGQMIVTHPALPCMNCIGFLTPKRLEQEENDYGDAGINPQVVWTNGTLASIAVGALVRLVTPWFRSAAPDFQWLELDGNTQTISNSLQPQYFLSGACDHFSATDLGDPFFDVRNHEGELEEQSA